MSPPNRSSRRGSLARSSFLTVRLTLRAPSITDDPTWLLLRRWSPTCSSELIVETRSSGPFTWAVSQPKHFIVRTPLHWLSLNHSADSHFTGSAVDDDNPVEIETRKSWIRSPGPHRIQYDDATELGTRSGLVEMYFVLIRIVQCTGAGLGIGA
jgi:hypothetical protein